MANNFKVGDVVRPVGLENTREGDGRVTIEIINGSPESPYGWWFHTNGKNPTGPWRDLTTYEIAPVVVK